MNGVLLQTTQCCHHRQPVPDIACCIATSVWYWNRCCPRALCRTLELRTMSSATGCPGAPQKLRMSMGRHYICHMCKAAASTRMHVYSNVQSTPQTRLAVPSGTFPERRKLLCTVVSMASSFMVMRSPKEAAAPREAISSETAFPTSLPSV